MTDGGKSTVARALFLSAASPRLVVDPTASTLTNVGVTVPGRAARAGIYRSSSSKRIRAAVIAELDRAWAEGHRTLRYVPVDPFGVDEYAAVYDWAFGHPPIVVWLDEAGIVAPAQGAPRELRRFVVMGRKLPTGHIACHTRPREVDPNLIAQAKHVLIWPLPRPEDRKYLADVAEVSLPELEQLLDGLPPYGFVWANRRRRTLTACAPPPR